MKATFVSRTVWVAAGLLTLWIAGAAKAQQTQNYVLRAVPAPGKVAINGSLKGWDLSGHILICYDLATLLKTDSVQAAAMYDSKYLYLAFQFKDPTPMVNHINPLTNPGSGWRSDSVQVHITTDEHVNLIAWYYTDKRMPWISIHYGMGNPKSPNYRNLNNALAAGAKEAFRKDPDGKGYVQEIALPWKLIRRSGKPCVAGQTFRMGIEAFWGNNRGRDPMLRYADLVNPQDPNRNWFWTDPNSWGNVVLLAHGHVAPSSSVQQVGQIQQWEIKRYRTRGPVPIRYQLPVREDVTLAIENPDGTRVKNLISDYPRSAGENVDYWDGTDDNGHLVAPGEYKVVGLYHQPLGVKYDFAFGNPGNPEWETANGKGGWLSNHFNPMDVAADGSHVYISAPFAEGAAAVMAANYKGQRQWGIANINGGMMASNGHYLYMLVGGPNIGWGSAPPHQVAIDRISAATGAYAPWTDGHYMHTIAAIPPKPNWYVPRPWFGNAVAHHSFSATWCQRQTMGLALAKGKLYASLYYQNKLVVVDPGTGKTIGTIAIKHPAGLAGGPDGSLYAISGKQVVKLVGAKTWVPVITSGLVAPVGLATDARGRLYVSDWGTAMCVKEFSPQGQFIRNIGQVGGRPLAGEYDPDGMFLPRGIAVDQQGRLWVAESDSTPRRISVWSTHTGKFLKEYCGSTHYASMGAWINPLNPQEAFVLGNICQLNWKRGLWRVAGTLWRPTRPNALFGFDSALSSGFGYWTLMQYHGRKLLIVRTTSLLCIAALHRYYARPLMVMGSVYGLWRRGEQWPKAVLDHLTKTPQQLAELEKKYPTVFSGMTSPWPVLGAPGVRSFFVWTDHNPKGSAQHGEIKFYAKRQLHGISSQGDTGVQYAIGPHFTVYMLGQSHAGQTRYQDVWRLPLKKWNKSGAPVYDLNDADRFARQPESMNLDVFIWHDRLGQTLVGQGPLMMFSSAGKLLWTYPNRWPGTQGSPTAPQAKRGRLIGTLDVLGAARVGHKVGDVFCMSADLGARFFMTTDGLFVGNVFRDCRSAPDALPNTARRGLNLNGMSAGGESFGGGFFHNPVNGRYYLYGSVDSCREASLVAQVTGLNSVRRLPTQTIQFAPADLGQARALLARRAIKATLAKRLSIIPVNKSVPVAPPYGVFDWAKGHVAQWHFDLQHSAMATWTYGTKNLYLCFRNVQDNTPMINHGPGVRELFKTGDAVEFDLRTQPNNNRPQVIAGDLRLVISVFHGKPTAVLYRYDVPGTRHPVPFTSPVGTTWIDQVRVLKNAKLAIDRTRGSYNVRATIPLAELGFHPQAGQTYRGDFGVVYSDPTGHFDVLRMYWSNPVNAMVSDLYSEAKISPGFWGRFVTGKGK